MPSIVQFMHPGPEHGSDSRSVKNHKKWNTGKHKRKFLCSEGEYIQNGQIDTAKLMFWGEWEPMSHVQKLNQNGNSLNPKWLHEPYLSNPIPNTIGLQNTDPFVFDNDFKYLLCQQFRKRPRLNITQLANLSAGSLILFGSVINAKMPNAFFQLDTVLVVNDWIPYNPLTASLNPTIITKPYYDVVYSKAYQNNQPNLDLRLYRGATFFNQIHGMYSFVPSQLYNGNKTGFSRIRLCNMKYLTNNLSQGFKITNNLNLNLIQKFWQKIVDISRQKGCVEGTRFYY